MNVKYRRPNDGPWITWKWVDAIALEFYPGWNKYFILRWSDLLQDFEEVLVPASRIRFVTRACLG